MFLASALPRPFVQLTTCISMQYYARFSGLVTSVNDFAKFSDDALNNLLNDAYILNIRTQDEFDNLNEKKLLNGDNGFGAEERVAGFIKLEDRERQFIERERSVLLKAIKVIQKAAPLVIL